MLGFLLWYEHRYTQNFRGAIEQLYNKYKIAARNHSADDWASMSIPSTSISIRCAAAIVSLAISGSSGCVMRPLTSWFCPSNTPGAYRSYADDFTAQCQLILKILHAVARYNLPRRKRYAMSGIWGEDEGVPFFHSGAQYGCSMIAYPPLRLCLSNSLPDWSIKQTDPPRTALASNAGQKKINAL